MSKLVQRQWIFVFALTFLVTFGSITATHSQTPSSRDAAIADIKKSAERHVKTDSSMQTSTVLKQFEKDNGGLTPPEIIKIYEDEYVRLKEAKEADPWERFLPKVGWMAAALLGLWAIFRDTINTWTKTLADKLFKSVYNRFAGTKLFRDIALKKYRQALIVKHCELRIPFRLDRPLKMQDVYVPLNVKGSQSYDLIDAYEAVSQYKRLMVTGQPGSGKSMLLKYLTLSEAEGRLQLTNQPVAVFLELFRLSDGSEILPQLVKALEREDFPHGENFLQQALDKGTVLLLLDGLDEVGSAA